MRSDRISQKIHYYG